SHLCIRGDRYEQEDDECASSRHGAPPLTRRSRRGVIPYPPVSAASPSKPESRQQLLVPEGLDQRVLQLRLFLVVAVGDEDDLGLERGVFVERGAQRGQRGDGV